VELALKSSESKLYLDALEKLLTPKIVGTAEYKKWWENAKKELKTSRHIVVPTKRADPLVLRAQDQKAGEIMVRNFLGSRELRGKLAAMTAIIKDLDLFENPAKELQPVFLDVTHMARKSWKLQPRETIQLVLLREEVREAESVKASIEHENPISVAEMMRDLRGQLADIANALPSALLGRFYRELPVAFAGRRMGEGCPRSSHPHGWSRRR
jgi:transcription elongation factor GreA-like protein